MKYEEIKDTPFVLIIDEDNDICFAACKNIKITHNRRVSEKDKIIKEVKKPTWNTILGLVQVMMEYYNLKPNYNGRN